MQLQCLQELGEHFLVERTLRALILTDGDVALRTAATKKLASHYYGLGDHFKRVGLFAAVAMKNTDAATMANLTSALVDGGYFREALALGLALPENHQPVADMIWAAYAVGWWQTFDDMLNRVNDKKAVQIWEGYLAQEQGAYRKALTHWSNGGEKGQKLAATLKTGMGIRQRLESRWPQIRRKAVVDWSQWQASHPGPWRWKAEHELISEYSKGVTLEAITLDRILHAFLATEQQPVRLNVVGPMRLRIEARPLHRKKQQSPIDGWLKIRVGQDIHRMPFSNNLPSRGLRIQGNDKRAPGQKVVSEINVPAGLHKIEVSAGDVPVLIRAIGHRPLRPIAVLPRLSASAVAALTAQRSGKCTNEKCPLLTANKELVHAKSKGRIQNAGVARYIVGRASTESVENKRCNLPGWLQKETKLSRHVDEVEAAQAMTDLLWRVENRGRRDRRKALVAAEALNFGCPKSPSLRQAYYRILRAGRWQNITAISESAGIRHESFKGWQPESQSGRVRKVLLQSLTDDAKVLSGYERIVLAMRNKQATTLRLKVSLTTIANLPRQPMTLIYQVGNGREHRVRFSKSRSSRTLKIRAPAGEYAIKLTVEWPVGNQYFLVRTSERGIDRYVQKSSRPYHVATHNEFVRFKVKGPAWIRVDRYQSGHIQSNYTAVASGTRNFILKPKKGEVQASFRVFTRRVMKQRRRGAGRRLDVNLVAVAEPLFVVDVKPPVESSIPTGHLPLGGQEDGTWSYGSQYVNRRNLDTDMTGVPAEQFVAFDATYRFYNADRNLFSRTRIFSRLRQQGGPALGVEGRFYFNAPDSNSDWMIDSRLLVQQPGGPSLIIGESTGTEWAATVRGELSQQRTLGARSSHRPAAELFFKSLSLNNGGIYEAGRVDQDVYTDYKRDHPYGIRLSETVVFRPWLDTLLLTKLSITSNADLASPSIDNFGIHAVWQQRLGSYQTSIAYKQRHYLSDANRVTAFNRRILQVGVQWEKWRSPDNRWEGRLRWAMDLDSAESSLWLGFQLHTGRARGYRDFHNRELVFRDIRSSQIPTQ
ncbi:MAG: hypothetical protein V3S12_02340 [Acidiferrobacterales bacterium]